MAAQYLILESNGKVTAIPDGSMNWAAVRETLSKTFPGARILAPLERPDGPVQVVTVYMSRTRDGRARISVIDQWGLQW